MSITVEVANKRLSGIDTVEGLRDLISQLDVTGEGDVWVYGCPQAVSTSSCPTLLLNLTSNKGSKYVNISNEQGLDYAIYFKCS